MKPLSPDYRSQFNAALEQASGGRFKARDDGALPALPGVIRFCLATIAMAILPVLAAYTYQTGIPVQVPS